MSRYDHRTGEEFRVELGARAAWHLQRENQGHWAKRRFKRRRKAIRDRYMKGST